MSCNEGVCVMSTDGLSITSISPAFGTVGEQTDVSITGTDFMVGLTVRVGATTIGVREVTGTQLITAIIPGDLNIGVYDVVVVNPDDAVATLPGAFEVRASGALSATTCGDGACESGEDCEACPIDCGPCEAVVPARSSGCSSGNGASIIWPLLVIIGWMTNRRRLPGVAQC